MKMTSTFNFYQYKHYTTQCNDPIELSTGLEFFCQQKHNFFCQLLSSKLEGSEDEGQPYQKGSNNGSNGSEKLFSKYKKCDIPVINSICIVEKMDHWEIICGHNSNTYSLWRMKLEDLHLPTTSMLSWEKVQTNKIYNINNFSNNGIKIYKFVK